MGFFNEMLEWAPAVGMTAGGAFAGPAAPYLIGAGLGAAKGKLDVDKARGDRKRAIEVESIKERYSPWTKQHGDANAIPNTPSAFSQMLGEGATGAMLGGMANQKGWFSGAGGSNAGYNGTAASPQLMNTAGTYKPMLKSNYASLFNYGG